MQLSYTPDRKLHILAQRQTMRMHAAEHTAGRLFAGSDSDTFGGDEDQDPCAMQFSYTPDRKLHILDRLAWSEMFESFLANKFAAAKRFGLEGCETLIPGMKALIDRSTDLGVDSIVMGMPHRGALPQPMCCSVQDIQSISLCDPGASHACRR